MPRALLRGRGIVSKTRGEDITSWRCDDLRSQRPRLRDELRRCRIYTSAMLPRPVVGAEIATVTNAMVAALVAVTRVM